MNTPFVYDLWCIFQPTGPMAKFVTIFVKFKELHVNFSQRFACNAASQTSPFRVPKWLFHIRTFTSFSPGRARRWARPISLWMVGWNKGHWVENVEISAFCGFCSPKRGKIFVNINFPRLKWVDYFFKMNCWDSPGGDKWFVLFFAPGAGWKWLESIYVRLLLQFSVFSFPGFNNADFNVAQKGCIFPSMICARMWVPKVELSSDDVLCCFLMFDWSISDYLVLFLCFYVNGE